MGSVTRDKGRRPCWLMHWQKTVSGSDRADETSIGHRATRRAGGRGGEGDGREMGKKNLERWPMLAGRDETRTWMTGAYNGNPGSPGPATDFRPRRVPLVSSGGGFKLSHSRRVSFARCRARAFFCVRLFRPRYLAHRVASVRHHQ